MPPAITPKKKDNKIDANEAQLIGDFLVTIGQELTDANNALSASVLKGTNPNSLDYYRIEDAKAEYRMEIEIGTQTDGSGKKRTSEVVMNANYHKVSPGSLAEAPYNVIFGNIAPAERHRDEILSILTSNSIVVSKCSPILAVAPNRFWVVDTDTSTHYVVELGLNVKAITSLTELNALSMSMFKFMREQLVKVYGE